MLTESNRIIHKSPPAAGSVGREEVRHPLRFFMWLTHTYGDIVQYRSTMEPAYLINHPDYIKHVLLSNAHNYDKNTFLNKYMLESLTGNGLLTSENPLWREQRRLIQPAFHRRTLPRFAEMMADCTQTTLERLDCAAETGEPVDIAREMMRLTLDIVTRALFSYDISASSETVGEAMDTMLAIGKPRHRKVRESIEALDRIVYGIIDDRLAHPDDSRDDLLNMLLHARYDDGSAMSTEQVRDEVMSLLVAGHETTANTLSWTWYLLAQHPEVVARLDDEFDTLLGGRMPTVEDFPNMTYTDRVIQESMRLYPSAWSISRRALHEDEIGGYYIPANSIVAMSPYTMHRHPAYWNDPERFDPDRFVPELVAQRPRFAYFPFGGGARQCIGNHFALMESMIIIPAVSQRYRMQLVPEHPVEEHALVTLRPRQGIRATLTRR